MNNNDDAITHLMTTSTNFVLVCYFVSFYEIINLMNVYPLCVHNVNAL